jgi:hypothetical protein
MRLIAFAVIAAVFVPNAFADEGMWTFDNLPVAKMRASYRFSPDRAWLERVRSASLRMAGGCSASLVSPDGLVMTNHHCSHQCIQDLSNKTHDFVKSGFLAKKLEDEKPCPAMELNQLVDIKDVTREVQDATKGVADAKFNDVQKAKIAELEKACAAGSADARCDVVSLFQGGRFALYTYRRYQDVRLVFAPELPIAFFGGDPDNFMFPRYDLDVSFLRIYGKDGKPVKTGDYFRLSQQEAQEGDMTFVSGNPGGTSRRMTVAQLEYQRDVALPLRISRLSEARGLLTEYQHRGAEQKRTSSDMLFYVENGLKARKGRHEALAEQSFMAAKIAAEKAFRDQVNATADLKDKYGGAWEGIAAATATSRRYVKTYEALERGFAWSELFGIARTLVRAADELPKNNGDRLTELTDGKLPQLKQGLFAKAPISDELQTAMLAFALTKLREDLGADHPVVRHVFGPKSPVEIATEAVKGTKLKDIKVRQSLFADGKGKVMIDASTDSMILLAKALDPAAREIRKKMEDEVDGPLKKNGELLAKAYFALYGTSTYPDGTFSPRLSYGSIKGWTQDGHAVNPITDFGGAYARASGREPFALPTSWIEAKARVRMSTPFNICTTNDIIGGNSGSPVINKAGEVIGLIFDGNLPSLGGDYGFDGTANRAVAVHAAALLEALDKIYKAKRLVDELEPEVAGRAGKP